MFRYFVLGFISTSVGVYQLAEYPFKPVNFMLLFSVASLLLALLWGSIRILKHSSLARLNQIIIQAILGSLVAFLLSFCVDKASVKLPESVLNHPIWLTGQVQGLVQHKTARFGEEKWQFTVKVHRIEQQEQTPAWQIFAPQIRLSWYVKKSEGQIVSAMPKAGEIWRFHVKLKSNHASQNPGAFDYETYLFQQHIHAHGYVLSSRDAEKNAERLAPSHSINLQQWVRDRLHPWFAESPFGGVFAALLYGDKSQIQPNQWQLFRQTGTIHLMAISGLHIGIMAAIGFWLMSLLWKGFVLHLPDCSLKSWVMTTPKILWGSFGATVFALFYMALAGFAIPTVRAGLMVLVILLFFIIRRRFQVWSALALVAFLVVLLDSRAVLSQGFWLSFMAVAIIYSVIASQGFRQAKSWQKMLWLQLALTFGMAPIMAWFYGQLPIISLLANLLAVPVVTLLALPLLMMSALLIVLLGSLLPPIAQWLIALNDVVWQGLWSALSSLQQLGHWVAFSGYLAVGQVSIVTLVIFYLMLAVWVNSQSLPHLSFLKNTWREGYRWLGALALVGGFFVVTAFQSGKQQILPLGSVKVTLLDVGQGQAMVFETKHHTVVYDTGPKLSASLDGASMAILPYLAHERRSAIDLLLVSHSDEDHAGGTATLLKTITVKQAVSGQAEIMNSRLEAQSRKRVFESCYAGKHWSFDQVDFEVLSPAKGASYREDNDTSCVLKIRTGKTAMLVMGDASKNIEQQLIHLKQKVQAQVLVAGHHGSQTATSLAWLKAVQPKLVLFSAGYQNRYHFPNIPVVQNIRSLSIPMLNTACSGAVILKMTPKGFLVENLQRIDHKTWYHHQCRLSPSNEFRQKALN